MVTKCIFISHSAKEPGTVNFLKLLSTQLKEDSFDVLVDMKRLNAGDIWKYKIHDWMRSCHGALIILSKSAIEDSMWVVREVNNLIGRRILEPNFVLIPIYFGVTPEDVKKNKLFDDLDLDKYQGIDGSKNLIQIRAEIIETLKQNHIETPLDEVANLIATKIECLSSESERRIEIIENVLGKLQIKIEPFLLNRDPCLILATKMLNLKLRESAMLLSHCDALNYKDVEYIFDLLAPLWVDLRAATSVSKCALHKEHKTVVLLNSSEIISAGMYVRRASNRPPNSWPILPISGVYGVDPVADIVAEIETLLIREFKLDEDDISYSQKQDILKSVLITRNQGGEPIFIALSYTKGVAKLLTEVQHAFPLITFFLSTGENFPAQKELEGLRFKFLEPPLKPNDEVQALYEIRVASAIVKR